MNEEHKYKQSRKQPTNPLEAFDATEAEQVMAKIKELEKKVPGIDPMAKSIAGVQGEMPFAIEGNVPQEFSQMFKKDGRASKQRETQESQMQPPATGPHLAYT